MTFGEHVRIKIPALLQAAIGMVAFIGIEYFAYFIFELFGIDQTIYRGVFNTFAAIVIFVAMFVFHKIVSRKNAPLIRLEKITPDQVAALTIVGIGMLGFVATYIGIANRISAYYEPVREAYVEYQDNVDRYSEVSQTVVPVWDSLLYAFTVSFLVPVSEEMAFRGVVYGSLRKGFGPWVSVIISAVFFGLMHGVSMHIGYALVCGFIIAGCYHLTENLIAPMILHTVFNIFGSGIANVFEIEQLGISEDTRSTILTAINLTSIIIMPVAVIAFAYLVSVKRKRKADKKKVEEYIAGREEEKAEATGDDTEPSTETAAVAADAEENGSAGEEA